MRVSPPILSCPGLLDDVTHADDAPFHHLGPQPAAALQHLPEPGADALLEVAARLREAVGPQQHGADAETLADQPVQADGARHDVAAAASAGQVEPVLAGDLLDDL